MTSFFVVGRPAPAGSRIPMVSRKTGKPFTRPASKYEHAWRSAVAAAARGHFNAMKNILSPGVPVILNVTFYMKRPKHHYKRGGELRTDAPKFPLFRPDRTKLLRATEDALTGIAWHDDAQVVDGNVRKRFADDYPEGAQIEISSWS